MIFEYQTGKVGCVSAGMDRSEVRRLLGKFEEFRKSPDSINTTDDFADAAAHVYYDNHDHVVGVEVHRESGLFYRGLSLMEKTPEQIESSLSTLSVECDRSDSSMISIEGGKVGMYLTEDNGGVDVVVSVYVDLSET